MSVFIAIIGLAVLVLIHEAGHFVAARAVGMRPRKFYLGFGPPIVKTVRGGVEYGIGSLPLGGYVKIPGMHRPVAGDLRRSLAQARAEELDAELTAFEAAVDAGQDGHARELLLRLEPELGKERMFQELEGALAPDAYWRQATWRRVTVIAAGPAVNVLIALVIFAAVFMSGSVVATRNVDSVLSGHPAAKAGLRAGDTVVRVDGHVVTPETIAPTINATGGRLFTIVVKRNGHRVTLGPLAAIRTEGVYRVGFQIAGAPGPGDSLATSVRESFHVVAAVTTGTVSALGGIATGKDTENVSSVVGMTRVASSAYQRSTADFLFILGLISLALGLLNLLPVLPLDGGHIVMSLLEKVRGRGFSQLAYMRYSAVGLALFAFLMYLGLRNDLFTQGG